MNRYNFKAVVFDIDACLIDSAPNLILTLDRAISDTGGGSHPPEYIRKMLGLPASCLDELFELPDWKHTLRTWSEYYAPLASENKPFDGIVELLTAIHDAGFRWESRPRRGGSCMRTISTNTDFRTFSILPSVRTMWSTQSPPRIRCSLPRGTLAFHRTKFCSSATRHMICSVQKPQVQQVRSPFGVPPILLSPRTITRKRRWTCYPSSESS